MSHLTYDDAKPAEGQAFTLVTEDGRELDLTLAAVERCAERGPRPEGFRAPFRLRFEGTRGHLCPQGIYRLRNAQIGEQAIFIVPVGCEPETEVYRYEAIFN